MPAIPPVISEDLDNSLSQSRMPQHLHPTERPLLRGWSRGRSSVVVELLAQMEYQNVVGGIGYISWLYHYSRIVQGNVTTFFLKVICLYHIPEVT